MLVQVTLLDTPKLPGATFGTKFMDWDGLDAPGTMVTLVVWGGFKTSVGSTGFSFD